MMFTFYYKYIWKSNKNMDKKLKRISRTDEYRIAFMFYLLFMLHVVLSILW